MFHLKGKKIRIDFMLSLNRDTNIPIMESVYVYINGARRFQETRLSNQAQALALILIDINQDHV